MRFTLSACLLTTAIALIPTQALPHDANDAAADTPTIRVIGHPDPEGLLPDQQAPAATSAVAAPFITKQAPTLNAFQLVNLLPGANVSGTDPFGLSTSSSLSLRGLGQDEIGVVMEGAPQNDIGYYFAYPAQFADTENLKSITLAQGTVEMDAPIVNGAGGLLTLSLGDPASRMGLLADATAGSYDEHRIFARIDTGQIGNTGITAFASASYNHVNNWRGAGFDTRGHVDAKALKTWDNGSRASLSISYNDARNSTYPSPTLADWQAQGRAFNYDPAYNGGDTNYWRLYRQPFRNAYLSAPVHVVLSAALTLDTTSYFQYGYGNSPYGTTLSTTGNYLGLELLSQPIALPGNVNGTATVLGNYVGDQRRLGNITKLTAHIGAHTLSAGLWLDRGIDRVNEGFTSLEPNGNPTDPWGYSQNAIHTADGRLLTAADFHTIIAAKAFFVADHIDAAPRLAIELGFKGVDATRDGSNLLPGDQNYIRATSFAALPRASAQYRLDDSNQIFAHLTTNFRAPDEFTLYDSYSGGAVYARGTTALKNEYSIAEELGWRYHGANLSAALTGFHYDFRNRQFSTVETDATGALVTTTLNAGGQTSWGVDAEIDWRPREGMSLYASAEALRARLSDNLPVAGDVLPTAGKHAPATPSAQFALGGTYDRKLLFGSFALKYVGRQYATFMNDESIAGYATLDLSIGVHLARWLGGKVTDLRLNAINLTNPHVLSGVAGITPNAADTTGTGGSTITGAAPSYYIAPGRAFAATLSRQF